MNVRPAALVLATPDEVMVMAAHLFSVDVGALRGYSRRRQLVRYRHAAMAACRLATVYSMADIGDAFGHRDASTVVHAVRRVAGDIGLHRLAVLVAEEVEDAQHHKASAS